MKKEEDFLIKKRRRVRRTEDEKSQSHNHHTSNKHHYVKKNKTTSKKSKKKGKLSRCVVKVTSGGATGYKSLIAHIDYISRNGKVKLITSDKSVFLGAKGVLQVKREMIATNDKLRYENDFNKTKQTYNMVFSMHDVKAKDYDKFIDAVHETLRDCYKNNYFVMALHEDTNHQHIHVSLSKRDTVTGKNIHLNKEALQTLKHKFSKKMIEKGFEVKLESKQRSFKRSLINPEKIKPTGVFELDECGRAPYHFKEGGSQSFYVTYLTTYGKKVTIWGKDLERALKESGAKKGDDIKLTKENEEEPQQKKQGKWTVSVYQTKEERELKKQQQAKIKGEGLER